MCVNPSLCDSLTSQGRKFHKSPSDGLYELSPVIIQLGKGDDESHSDMIFLEERTRNGGVNPSLFDLLTLPRRS